MRESDQIRELSEKMKALGDPIRIRILKLLSNRELSVGEITEILDIPQPTISRKLGELKRAGILSYRKSGKLIFYSFSFAFTHSQLKNIVVTAQAREFTSDLEKMHAVIRKRTRIYK
jgi:DNA-binding transcriptional ArsR family regulator